jgi:hypothetical protein
MTKYNFSTVSTLTLRNDQAEALAELQEVKRIMLMWTPVACFGCFVTVAMAGVALTLPWPVQMIGAAAVVSGLINIVPWAMAVKFTIRLCAEINARADEMDRRIRPVARPKIIVDNTQK